MINIAVIGAGSAYTADLIEKFYEARDTLPVRKFVFYDINEKRLDSVISFCRRFARHLKYDVVFEKTLDRKQAVLDANFVVVQIRVGGLEARVVDEKTAIGHGQIGQETTGVVGFMKALRTIPVMLDLAREIEECNPDAWVINYTNPTGIVTEAVTRFTKVKTAGICSAGFWARDWVARALQVDPELIQYDYIGLNHLNFSYNVTIGGKALTKDQLSRVAESDGPLDSELTKKLGLFANYYLQFYYHTSRNLEEMKNAEKTRGEVQIDANREILTAFDDEKQDTKPAVLSQKALHGYSEVALSFIDAILHNKNKWMMINVPNCGTVKWLPDDAVIEAGCMVNSAGIKPLAVHDTPSSVWGLISAVKNYEQLTVEAGVHGSRDTALLALVAHPLIREYDLARTLLDDLLEKNRKFLPQFYPKG